MSFGVVIAPEAEEHLADVAILGVYSGGQDHEVALRAPEDN